MQEQGGWDKVQQFFQALTVVQTIRSACIEVLFHLYSSTRAWKSNYYRQRNYNNQLVFNRYKVYQYEATYALINNEMIFDSVEVRR